MHRGSAISEVHILSEFGDLKSRPHPAMISLAWTNIIGFETKTVSSYLKMPMHCNKPNITYLLSQNGRLSVQIYIAQQSFILLYTYLWGRAVTHCTNGFWAHDRNLVKIDFALILMTMIQSGHNFAHVTTTQLSWHVQNYDLIWSLFFE